MALSIVRLPEDIVSIVEIVIRGQANEDTKEGGENQ